MVLNWFLSISSGSWILCSCILAEIFISMWVFISRYVSIIKLYMNSLILILKQNRTSFLSTIVPDLDKS